MLATFFPLKTLMLLGDVPVPAGAPPWLAYLLPLLPALGLWLFSSLVGALNQVVRTRDAEGTAVSPRLRLVLAVLNVMAGNLDKTKQQVAAAKEPTP